MVSSISPELKSLHVGSFDYTGTSSNPNLSRCCRLPQTSCDPEGFSKSFAFECFWSLMFILQAVSRASSVSAAGGSVSAISRRREVPAQFCGMLVSVSRR